MTTRATLQELCLKAGYDVIDQPIYFTYEVSGVGWYGECVFKQKYTYKTEKAYSTEQKANDAVAQMVFDDWKDNI